MDDFDICVFNGSQEGISKAFEMFVTPGDNVLVESPTYSGTLAILKPMDCNLLPVETDNEGLIPSSLLLALQKCPPLSKPKVLYTVPVSSNPSGVTTSLERKKQIYDICRSNDLIIIEDDPYYYLQYSKERVGSYFSIDVDGRVLRFDSFSKILSSGMRVGFASGPKELINRLVLHSQASNLHPSGISQIIVLSILRKWGIQGFLDHVEFVSSFYKKRRDSFISFCDKYLLGMAKWNVPSGGMFLWFDLSPSGITNSKGLIKEKAVHEKVLMLPGEEFSPDERVLQIK
jgi:kynurenine/2-aminoadipate aminotransferase